MSEALRLADALEEVSKWSGSEHWDTLEEAAAELRRLHAALAEPEQEPDGISWLKRDSGYFTAPTPRKPLTEGEMPTLFVGGLALNSEATTEIVRAVEKAHGIGERHE